ncbi:hypothetical protein GO013_15550 [Pseudodesulfovibrio sp. JC047]|uniref:hypothetical protein n=1 Tax=Pseudodesulfovibrio sp. JC047 TaxID=2683199 RepID=UPI0013D8C40F|nr:hypothetical protein [Pseudodesulfovibrio sp. JC047]NDV20825.1 hypothetical protein [Pseudodesulfovibrio sp. JC047]
MPRIQTAKTGVFPFDDAKVEIRAFMPGDRLEIEANTLDVKREYRPTEDGEFDGVIVANTDRLRDMEMTVIKRVVGWDDKMLDENDTPMKCTDENKIKAMRGMDGFYTFVEKYGKQLDADVRKEKELERKNSVSTPSGSEKAATK